MPVSPRAGSPGPALVLALLVLLPAIATAATTTGRGIAGSGPLEMAYLPVSLILFGALLARQLVVVSKPTRRAIASVQAVGGAFVAFEGARVLSTLWLLWGPRLIPDETLAWTMGASLLALIGGLGAMIHGIRASIGDKRLRRASLLAGIGLAATPLVPWILLTGNGSAVLLFNDFSDPGFSAFPGDGRVLAALWTTVAGLASILLTGLMAGPERDPGGRMHRLAGGFGVVAVVAAHGLLVWRVLALSEAFEGGSLWPGFNVLPLVLALGAGYLLSRSPSEGAREPGVTRAVQVTSSGR